MWRAVVGREEGVEVVVVLEWLFAAGREALNLDGDGFKRLLALGSLYFRFDGCVAVLGIGRDTPMVVRKAKTDHGGERVLDAGASQGSGDKISSVGLDLLDLSHGCRKSALLVIREEQSERQLRLTEQRVAAVSRRDDSEAKTLAGVDERDGGGSVDQAKGVRPLKEQYGFGDHEKLWPDGGRGFRGRSLSTRGQERG